MEGTFWFLDDPVEKRSCQPGQIMSELLGEKENKLCIP